MFTRCHLFAMSGLTRGFVIKRLGMLYIMCITMLASGVRLNSSYVVSFASKAPSTARA